LNNNREFVETDYESLCLKSKEEIVEKYCSGLPEVQMYEEGILKAGYSTLLNVKIELHGFVFESKLLFKVEGNSLLGKFHYQPVIFLETENISKENRMENCIFSISTWEDSR
jgi:hypothetical protein